MRAQRVPSRVTRRDKVIATGVDKIHRQPPRRLEPPQRIRKRRKDVLAFVAEFRIWQLQLACARLVDLRPHEIDHARASAAAIPRLRGNVDRVANHPATRNDRADRLRLLAREEIHKLMRNCLATPASGGGCDKV